MGESGNRRLGDNAERIVCLFWITLAILVGIGSYKLDLGTFSQPGPGFLPFGAAFFLCLFSTVQLMVLSRVPDEKLVSRWSEFRWPKVSLVVAILFAYVFALPWLGYLASTFILMLILFSVLRKMKWWIAISYAVLVVGITHLLFAIWLKVQFPKGFFGF